jgi:class 3 adenylate cyclase
MGSDDAAARNALFTRYCPLGTETAPIVCAGQAEAHRRLNTRRSALPRAATILSCDSVDAARIMTRDTGYANKRHGPTLAGNP